MINSLRQRAWSFVHHTFPERQIYVRSDGRVQFFTFSTQMQAVFAAIALVFLGWVAFTSVNVIFKDRILAAKEHRFDQMQTSYENRIADLQLSYDELNGALVVAQDRFKAIADNFEARQQAIASVIEAKKDLLGSLGAASSSLGPAALRLKPAVLPSGIGGVFDALSPDYAAGLAPPAAAAATPAPATPAAQEPAVPAKPAAHAVESGSEPQTFFRGAVLKLGSFFHRKFSANASEHPIVKAADAQSARIVRLGLTQTALLGETTQDLDKESSRLTRALKATGVDTKKLLGSMSAEHGTKALWLAAASSEIGEGDDSFSQAADQAAGAIQKLDAVVAALHIIPLITPTEFGAVSSGFGARVDPFNEQLAFHSGVDYSGPLGSDVRATAAGIVVFAGARGAYGNTVEVDHGYGVRTRYGHLSKILVQIGTKLEKGATVGRLGSTGRSTGPHVHYEVWYDDAVRDPSKFIKAGQYVLEE